MKNQLVEYGAAQALARLLRPGEYVVAYQLREGRETYTRLAPNRRGQIIAQDVVSPKGPREVFPTDPVGKKYRIKLDGEAKPQPHLGNLLKRARLNPVNFAYLVSRVEGLCHTQRSRGYFRVYNAKKCGARDVCVRDPWWRFSYRAMWSQENYLRLSHKRCAYVWPIDLGNHPHITRGCVKPSSVPTRAPAPALTRVGPVTVLVVQPKPVVAPAPAPVSTPAPAPPVACARIAAPPPQLCRPTPATYTPRDYQGACGALFCSRDEQFLCQEAP